jgi:hypothetical protein
MSAEMIGFPNIFVNMIQGGKIKINGGIRHYLEKQRLKLAKRWIAGNDGGMGRANKEEIPLEKLQLLRDILGAMATAADDAVKQVETKERNVRMDGWFTLGQALQQALAQVCKFAGPGAEVHEIDALAIYEQHHRERLAARKSTQRDHGDGIKAAENKVDYNRRKKQ